MKLLSLKIEGYKNLKDKEKVSIDFSNSTNYTALIGLNGSGKSNILEAISLIFSSLYHNSKLDDDFNYEIIYEINNIRVRINSGEIFATELEQEEIKVNKSEQEKYLPNNIITSYSGEELRLWESIYNDSYSDFFKDIKKQSSKLPRLLYVNKYCWEFALIVLICSENKKVKSFVKNILNINPDNVEVIFDIDEEKYGAYEKNNALSLIKRFVEFQQESENGSIAIKTIASMELNHQNNEEFTRKLFEYLFITAMPVRNDKIKVDKIIKSIEVKFDDINLKKLSEGEKKLILIYTIMHILSNDNSLILLDEPDAHVHIDRKKDIIDIINKDDYFTILTTHSPTILNCIDENNIKLIKNTKETGIEVLQLDKINTLSELTNGEFSIMDATLALSTSKDILLVEGTNDYNYIKEAIKKLSPSYDDWNFHIINCGGADNIPIILEQSLLPILKDTQLCLCTFDYDEQGRRNHQKVKELVNSKLNIKTMYHPKIDGSDYSDEDNDFYMESYFPLSVYQSEIMNQITTRTDFKSLENLKKDLQSPKSIIKKKYKKLDKSDYENFKILLDKTIRIKNDFYSQS